MKAFVATAGLFFVILLASNMTSSAQAQGFHFGGGGVHVDIGSPHRYYGNYGGYYGGFNGAYNNRYSSGYGGYPHTSYYGGGGGGHAHWHDTTHLDYHPGEVVRHRNHFHYVPGHYDVHEEGHWDHHGF